MDTIRLQGLALPKLGLGTYRLQGAACQAAVESAIALGYRHIDTAEMYGNEDAIGAALDAAGTVPVHLTSKVWVDNLSPDAMRRAIEASLKKLRRAQLDLYLVHWPARGMDVAAVMKTLMTLQDEGWTRAIGVANFTLPLLRQVVEQQNCVIACNQIEYHVYLDQAPMRDWLAKHGIALVAYCPLAQGLVADDPVLRRIAAKHGAESGQVALKWLLDQEMVGAIPKAGSRQNQKANLDALSLVLDDDDRAAIAALRKDRRLVAPGFGPVWDRF
ncbi:MAG: aldo/keto reductase [Asticcacaulis sp.]|nr:aldo/keto reductase [Asticcacaulis sp.]